MLKLIDIKKDYVLKDQPVVHALKGVTLSFRRNEFVAILGPSGCGKTTLLNITGGLDRYTSGDLIIEGRSTKNYKDSDWDTYRNHSIGFVFQSYNLIAHQSVLKNVELGLTISGVGKAERKQRALAALEKVGLKGLERKKPNQMSGGQMQRVAIARALVNNPEILLADEPTGALDSETSIQIMDLLKEVAKDRLVIMVTHNPELAEEYANRIVTMKDGVILNDTHPYVGESDKERADAQAKKIESKGSKKKSSMSFLTATALSCSNLLAKSKRSTLVSIAGSIGIIGISCVLAVSFGVTNYIESMQDDMLSGNPIEISETTIDLNMLMSSMTASQKVELLKEKGYVNVESVVDYLVERADSLSDMTKTNTINDDLLDYLNSIPEEYIAEIAYDYGFNIANNIYTGMKINDSSSEEMTSLSCVMATYTSLLQETEFKDYTSMISLFSNIISQAPGNQDYILSQYDLLDGHVAKDANEIMIVVDKANESMTDISLAQLGYYTQDSFINIAYKALEDPSYNPSLDKDRFSYEELMNKTFTYYPNNAIFKKTMSDINPFDYYPYAVDDEDEPLTGGYELKVVGILKPKENVNYGCLTRGFYYTPELTKKYLADNMQSYLSKYIRGLDGQQITSTIIEMGGTKVYYGVKYDYHYSFTKNNVTENKTGTTFVGSSSAIADMIMSYMGSGANSVYYLTLRNVGGVDKPETISIYPTNFDLKAKVNEYLDAWNTDDDLTITYDDGSTKVLKAVDRDELTYTDTLAIIIDMINKLIKAVTIALIAFTSLSLVVSCFMIAVITYISVVERVKEIGVIRSLGGRKRDVSSLFIAETLIIGILSGLIGVATTYILSIILNAIVAPLGVNNIAALPIYMAVVMLLLSAFLNVISGLVPSMKASKQDPVIALRSE